MNYYCLIYGYGIPFKQISRALTLRMGDSGLILYVGGGDFFNVPVTSIYAVDGPFIHNKKAMGLHSLPISSIKRVC